jgi:xanthine dehydrogenase large subunit
VERDVSGHVRRPSDVVGAQVPDESAVLHVTGRATFTDDIPVPADTAHGVLALSTIARGRILSIDTSRATQVPGVLAVLTAADVPGENSHAPRAGLDPLLAGNEVSYVGQPLAMVVATSRRVAEKAAAAVRVEYQENPPVLDPRAAHEAGDYVVEPMHLEQPTADTTAQALAAAPNRLHGTVRIGGQEHFYLETMTAVARRLDDGSVTIHCSTQHPSEVQHVAAKALGIADHRVRVECRRMGGAFGGKESQAAQVATLAAVGAAHVGRTVNVRLDRLTDDRVTGKRHPFEGDWDIGFDDEGRILGYHVTLLSNGGHSTDLSGPVLTRAINHVDHAYWLPAVVVDGYAARTNTQSNTAFRGFGGPQGAFVTELAIDSIARHLGRDPLDVRLANIYGARSTPDDPHAGLLTPYDMIVEDNVLPDLIDQLLTSSDYRRRRQQVASYNATSPILKRGIALTPVKFGIAFTLTHLNQAGALVHIYTDGSVLVNHSATEMGQGVNTKVCQVVAEELGISLDRVRSSATDTEKVANTSATAASSGADLNGMAAQAAARTIRDRLAHVAAGLLDCGADELDFRDGRVEGPEGSVTFLEVVTTAYTKRVQLWSDGFYATPGLHWNRHTMKGRPFHYFCYGASVSEVMIDTLTGEHRVLRADLLHDVGRSLNPRIDLGQVEGAFVQGMGWLTTEELHWDPATGTLETLAPTTYKIPAVHDIPPDFRVALYDNTNLADTIHHSKAVGEPPLLLAFSVFLAIRDAISAVGDHRADPPLRAPATVEAILEAVDAVRQLTAG